MQNQLHCHSKPIKFGKQTIPTTYVDSELQTNLKIDVVSKVESFKSVCGDEVQFLKIQLIYAQADLIFFKIYNSHSKFLP